MNIAVVLDQIVQNGGGFQQSLSTMLILDKKRSLKYNFIYYTTHSENISRLKKYGIKCNYVKIRFFDKIANFILKNINLKNYYYSLRMDVINNFERLFNKAGIDLVYFLSSSTFVTLMYKYNYIITVWDLCHRDYLEFREVYQYFKIREKFYSKHLPRAISIITDSEQGKENIIKRYNVDRKRLKPLPFVPPDLVKISKENYDKNYVNIKFNFNILGDYIFYPAQFWGHKNHIYILDGLKIIKDNYNLQINAIFTGADKGNLAYVKKYARQIGVYDQIRFTGFVDNSLIPYLYRQSIALVMPTYFGPTNLPPLEAFAMETPVLYSDIPGAKEQLGNAALLMDLDDPWSLVNHLMELIQSTGLREKLIKRGIKKNSLWTEDDYWYGIKSIFDEYRKIKRCCHNIE